MAARDLVGRRLEGIVKQPADRSVRFDLGGGHGLAFELTPNRVNLVALGEHGAVVAALRQPKGSDRLAPGTRWSPSALPPGRLDPFECSAEAIDASLAAPPEDGPVQAELLSRRLAGVGIAGAELVVEESRRTGRSVGSVLRERVDSILRGESELVIDEPEGLPAGSGARLLPWRPAWATPGRIFSTRGGAGATAASFYEARDEEARTEGRIAALGAILQRELSRTRGAAGKVREELRSFEDPERYRRMGEALLAGLRAARRTDDSVIVPDPYDEMRELTVPAAPGKLLTQVADDLFKKHRRSRRGLESARHREATLVAREARLESLLAAHDRVLDDAGADALEARMREEGIPVGLAGPTRAARAAARVAGPKLAGVRIITSVDGWTILVGRTGPDNDRLTFKFAAPEDFWLHAAGCPGAHVVIRNPERRKEAPAGTLAEAAGLALWFSEGRSRDVADVQWTRRKYVRRTRGGGSGTVVLKRFETIRTRAHPPREET